MIIAGLSSSSGKTFITLGILRALQRRKASIAAAKTGPDYIDPGFHHAAIGKPSVNLDGFAMSLDMLTHLAAEQTGDVLITEGVMGVFDGNEGSAHQLAQHLGAPIILVLDIRGQSETAGEIAAGLSTRLKADGVHLAGVILNRSRSQRHGELVKSRCAMLGVKVFGVVADRDDVHMPSRHLGLVQAADLAASDALNTVLDLAADAAEADIDLDQILAAAAPLRKASSIIEAMPPLGQRIAVAHDAAFGFSYTHILEGWRRMGAEVSTFSPLADEAPCPDADAIFLPGGYPELHLPALADAHHFADAMKSAAAASIKIYGECGGYMCLGKQIIDGDGTAYPMLGLLDLETSFVAPTRVLGYRQLRLLPAAPLPLPTLARGHEFHFTRATMEKGERLFEAEDKSGKSLGAIGLKSGSVAGSYAHIIAQVTA